MPSNTFSISAALCLALAIGPASVFAAPQLVSFEIHTCVLHCTPKLTFDSRMAFLLLVAPPLTLRPPPATVSTMLVPVSMSESPVVLQFNMALASTASTTDPVALALAASTMLVPVTMLAFLAAPVSTSVLVPTISIRVFPALSPLLSLPLSPLLCLLQSLPLPPWLN
jgi:hypothetical protein